jgi:hypothetical protein
MPIRFMRRQLAIVPAYSPRAARQMEGKLYEWIPVVIMFAVVAYGLAWILSDPDFRPPKPDSGGLYLRGLCPKGLHQGSGFAVRGTTGRDLSQRSCLGAR